MYGFAAAFLITLSALFLSFPNLGLGRTGSIVHEFTKDGEDELALAFPNDPVPRFNFASVSQYPAHNIKEPVKHAFATMYCTRKPDTRDPYFEATQSLIWRILWSEYRSKFPIVVFVCPFIDEKFRRILRGQGALVKEIDLLDDIVPDKKLYHPRWMDVLSKLHIWKETEWERIVFLDSDAFPITNIDDVFDLMPVQRCKKELLGPEDKAVVDSDKGEDMCNYVYAGVWQTVPSQINAGMLVIKPNLQMHAKLVKAARSTGDYDIRDMEQGVLRSKNAFAADGPFPVNSISPVWNGLPEYYSKYLREGLESKVGPMKILHVKMWNRLWGVSTNLTQLNDMWDLDWMKMCRFYDSDEGFVIARKTGIYKSSWERYLEREDEKRTQKQP